ncbi:MAG: hypothetical protein GY833_26540, partial [Aestuariibacter sp.]|nr:hypothetical protein [Aestuariibacter sp.]
NIVITVLVVLLLLVPFTTALAALSFSVEAGNGVVDQGSTLVSDVSDDSSTQITINDTIEGGLKLGGTTYNDIYVGSNGYITFGHPQTSFNPAGIASYTDGPMIAAQYDDIDPSKGGSIYINEDDTNDRVTVTWYQVAPFGGPNPQYGSGVNTFQIRLHGTGGGNGDFGIEFRYDTINWIGGGGSGLPTAGWTFGDQTTYSEVSVSGETTFLTIESETNISHPGVFGWDVSGGSVV